MAITYFQEKIGFLEKIEGGCGSSRLPQSDIYEATLIRMSLSLLGFGTQ